MRDGDKIVDDSARAAIAADIGKCFCFGAISVLVLVVAFRLVFG